MHPIIFLWCHPRSVSSAMERVMRERGDLKTLHEPFLYHYYVGNAVKKLSHFEPDPSHPTSYADIRDSILEAGEKGPVFVKDMAYYVTRDIAQDPSFMSRLTHSFLIRSPRKSIPSFYAIDKFVTSEEIGLESEWQIFDEVRKLTGNLPPVVEADDLRRAPAATIEAYCKALELPFLSDALQWNTVVPDDWQHVAGWHSDLDATSGIQTETNQTRPGVDDISELGEFCAHHEPFYERLREFTIKI